MSDSKSTEDILKEIYYDPETGLGSADNTLRRVKQKYPNSNLVKQSHAAAIKIIKEFIQNQKVGQLFQQVKPRRSSGYYPITAPYGPFSKLMIDLMDVHLDHPNSNEGIEYLFICIDADTRYVFVVKQKTKNGLETLSSFQAIMKKIWSMDDGKFKSPNDESQYTLVVSDNEGSWKPNTDFARWCENNHIKQKWVQDDFKSKSIVERFIRTLRWMIRKYLASTGSVKYIDKLDSIIKNYNTSYHSRLKTTPTDAIKDNSKYHHIIALRSIRIAQREKQKGIVGLKKNDSVRMLLTKRLIKDPKEVQTALDNTRKSIKRKENQLWSSVVYKVKEVLKHNKYLIGDDNYTLITPFRRQELLAVDESSDNNNNDTYHQRVQLERENTVRNVLQRDLPESKNMEQSRARRRANITQEESELHLPPSANLRRNIPQVLSYAEGEGIQSLLALKRNLKRRRSS